MNKVKKGDVVTVITGKDKGVSGKVLATIPSKNKVVVEGVNVATVHKKARKQNEKSEIVKVEKAIDASNVKVNCPNCGPVRVRFEIIDGKKVRVCVKCGAVIADSQPDRKTAKKEPAKKAKRTTKKEETVEAEVKKPRKRTAKTEEPKE